MSERYEISKIDIIPIQTAFWILTGICTLMIIFFLVFDFTLNTFYTGLFGLVLNGVLQYFSSKTWNVWYQDGKMYFENIYQTKIYDIELFKRIEMTSVFGNNYRIYLKNNKTYNFRIKQTDDFKLLFKNDDQYYAKELTRRLNELK